jgi:magnesium-transporting ATPase (P-type)
MGLLGPVRILIGPLRLNGTILLLVIIAVDLALLAMVIILLVPEALQILVTAVDLLALALPQGLLLLHTIQTTAATATLVHQAIPPHVRQSVLETTHLAEVMPASEDLELSLASVLIASNRPCFCYPFLSP